MSHEPEGPTMTQEAKAAETGTSAFDFYECPECGFDSVQRADFDGSTECPLCAGDSGHDVEMLCRPALRTDKPEGFDARLGTRSEQASGQPR